MTTDALIFGIVMPAIVVSIGLIYARWIDRAADKYDRERASRRD